MVIIFVFLVTVLIIGKDEINRVKAQLHEKDGNYLCIIKLLTIIFFLDNTKLELDKLRRALADRDQQLCDKEGMIPTT
jgi:hypothetical protein